LSSKASLWPWRLLSLALALALWFQLSYREREQPRLERALDTVNVTYETPDGFVLLNPVSTVAVRASGTENAFRDLNPFQVSATVALTAAVGIQEIVLDESTITRPPGIEVIAIDPDRLSLQVDREIAKSLRVEIDSSGEPAAGALEGEHRVLPDTVTVQGPESLLARTDVIVANVDIGGRAKSFTIPVSLDPGDPLIRIQGSSTVTVQVLLETPLLSPEATNGVNSVDEANSVDGVSSEPSEASEPPTSNE
jgi:hypothetical protein